VIGGDVLVVGGTCRMIGCTFTITAGFSSSSGVGFSVAVLGGSMFVTWSLYQYQAIFTNAIGPGQIFWCGAGVLVMTGFDFRLVVAALSFVGLGDFTTAGGVLIMTAVSITNAYPLLFATGGGFYIAVLSGVLVQTGVTYAQFNGPAFNALAGGSILVGTGTSIGVGCPSVFTFPTSAYAGIGAFSYNGAGVSVWVGSPLASYSAIASFYGAGAVTAQSAGWLTWVGCPVFLPVGE
jgi:hypothetical protein